MRPVLLILLGALGLLVLATSLFAGEAGDVIEAEVPPDSVQTGPVSFTGAATRFDLESHLRAKPSPWKSVLLSAIYPGIGQLNNGSWAKSTAFIVIGSLLVANTVVESHRVDRYRDLVAEAEDGDEALHYYDQYTSHLDRRDSLTWWTVGFWALNLLDAYVGGHLFSFSKQ